LRLNSTNTMRPKRTAEYQSADDVERVRTALQECATSCKKVEKSERANGSSLNHGYATLHSRNCCEATSPEVEVTHTPGEGQGERCRRTRRSGVDASRLDMRDSCEATRRSIRAPTGDLPGRAYGSAVRAAPPLVCPSAPDKGKKRKIRPPAILNVARTGRLQQGPGWCAQSPARTRTCGRGGVAYGRACGGDGRRRSDGDDAGG